MPKTTSHQNPENITKKTMKLGVPKTWMLGTKSPKQDQHWCLDTKIQHRIKYTQFQYVRIPIKEK